MALWNPHAMIISLLCMFLPAGCIKRIYATKPPKLKIRQHTNNRKKVVL